MEPANLNPEPSEEAMLKAWYTQNSTPLPDDGFSARVLAILPPQRAARNVPTTAIAVALGALTGIAFALINGASLDGLAALDTDIQAVAAAATDWLSNPTLMTAVSVTALSLLIGAAAVRHELRRR